MTIAERQTAKPGAERPTWLPEGEFPFESRFLDLDGHRIHFVDEGSGPTLLFVHAGAAWSFVYRDLILRLRDEFRCVALDFPDSGLSHAAEGYRPGLETASGVLERFVLGLDLHDVTLVVHDLGGPVSFGVAARHPERFLAMAVTESFGWPLGEETPKVAKMLRLVGGRMFRAVNRATNLLARGTATSLGVGRHLTREGRRAFRGPYRRREVRENALLMLRDAADAHEYMRGVDRALRTTLSDRPLLLVHGGKSPTLREGFHERWLSRFPGAQLLVLDGAHHFPQMDEPDVVAERILSWWHESVGTHTGKR